MNGSEQNEVKRQFGLKKALFSVFIPPTTHFEQILNENEQELQQNWMIFIRKHHEFTNLYRAINRMSQN
jgi:hypothetical protein